MEVQGEKELIKFWDFLKKNKKVIIAVVIAVILTYGYEMSNFALTIDEEANWNKTGLDYFIRRVSDGRFFLGFTKLFFPRILLPFWSTAVFALGMALNGCLLAYIFRDSLKSTLSRCAVACIFASFPVHAYYIMFSNMSAETALGYFMTILAVYIVDKNLRSEKKRVGDFVVAGVGVILANGVYQAFFCVYIILVCAIIFVDLLKTWYTENEQPKVSALWKRIGGHIVGLIVFGIGYVLVIKILQVLIAPSRNYVESFLQWGEKDFFETIKVFIQVMIRLSWSTGSDHAYVTMWIFTALFVVLFIVGLWRCALKYKLLFLISMCGLFFSNYLMMFVAGNSMPERTFLTIPIFAAIVLSVFIETVLKKHTQVLWAILVAGVVLVQSANVTDLFWAEDRRQEKDEVMLTKLTSEIAEVGGAWVPDMPVVIFTNTSYDNYDSTFGFSYFALGGRIYGYLEMYGFDYLQGDSEQVSYASERAKTMPSYPAEGSVILENGIIIVKCNELQ